MSRTPSRSSSSSSTISQSPRCLTLVQFHGERGGCEQHWSLFLPSRDGRPWGMLGHIQVRKDRKKRVVDCTPLCQYGWNIRTTKSTFYAFPIPDTSVHESDLERAVQEVYNACFSGNANNPGSPQYHMVKNNCQHFCYLVLRNLHWKFPHRVAIEAINFVESSSTPLLAITNLIRALRGNEGLWPKPYPKGGYWWRFNPRRQATEYMREDGSWWDPPSQQPLQRHVFID